MAANGWSGIKNGWPYKEFWKLEQYYFDRLFNKTSEITQDKMRYIVWQDGKRHTFF